MGVDRFEPERSRMVKAIVYEKYGPPEVLELRDVPKPEPAEDEVRIRIHATVATPPDCSFRKAEPVIVRFFTGLTRPKNTILGTAFAGEVEATGAKVARFRPGDRVFGASNTRFGTYAEYVCVPQDGILEKLPPNLPFDEGVSISEGFLTAIAFLRDVAQIRRGHRVLINGASGSVGVNAVQIAKYFGADVTGVCSTQNIDLVSSLGADRVIDYTKEDFAANGHTYDIVFDTVAKAGFGRSKRAMTDDGVFLVTAPSLGIALRMIWTSFAGGKKAKLSATGLRPAADQTRDLGLLNELYAEGKIRAVIDRRYPLAATADAHRYVDGGHKRGSVVISIGEPLSAAA